MAGVLIFGENCKYCIEVLNFVKEHPVLIPMIRTHNINRQGVPEGVTRVPMVITTNGDKHVGLEVLRWLETMIPTTFEGNCSSLGFCYDEPFDGVGDGFPLDSYGIALSPPLNTDLKNKIDKPLNEAYADIKSKHKAI